jgi:hypothetical protein
MDGKCQRLPFNNFMMSVCFTDPTDNYSLNPNGGGGGRGGGIVVTGQGKGGCCGKTKGWHGSPKGEKRGRKI